MSELSARHADGSFGKAIGYWTFELPMTGSGAIRLRWRLPETPVGARFRASYRFIDATGVRDMSTEFVPGTGWDPVARAPYQDFPFEAGGDVELAPFAAPSKTERIEVAIVCSSAPAHIDDWSAPDLDVEWKRSGERRDDTVVVSLQAAEGAVNG